MGSLHINTRTQNFGVLIDNEARPFSKDLRNCTNEQLRTMMRFAHNLEEAIGAEYQRRYMKNIGVIEDEI